MIRVMLYTKFVNNPSSECGIAKKADFKLSQDWLHQGK